MNKKQKFENFLESLKGKDQDALIESIKKGFNACIEAYQEPPKTFDMDKAANYINRMCDAILQSKGNTQAREAIDGLSDILWQTSVAVRNLSPEDAKIFHDKVEDKLMNRELINTVGSVSSIWNLDTYDNDKEGFMKSKDIDSGFSEVLDEYIEWIKNRMHDQPALTWREKSDKEREDEHKEWQQEEAEQKDITTPDSEEAYGLDKAKSYKLR